MQNTNQILVIEGNRNIRQLLTVCLTFEGYTVVPLEGEQETIAWITQALEPCQLILLDLKPLYEASSIFIHNLHRHYCQRFSHMPGLIGMTTQPALYHKKVHPVLKYMLAKPFHIDQLKLLMREELRQMQPVL